MDISIVIVSYNTVALLADCLNSIKEHTTGVDYQIIVVDNGSKDNSPQMTEADFPAVVLIKNQENLGFSVATNQGIKSASGDYVLLLNSDTRLIDDSLTKMVNFLRDNPQIGGLNPRLLNADGSLQVPGSSFLNFEKWKAGKPHTLKWVSGAAALIPRQLLDEIGLLDEKFFFYNEDLDLSLRIRRRGFSLYYYPMATVIHLGGQSSASLNEEALWYGYQGGFYYCRKHYGKTISHLYKTAVLTELGIRITALMMLFPFSHSNKTKDRITAYQRIFKDAWGGQM